LPRNEPKEKKAAGAAKKSSVFSSRGRIISPEGCVGRKIRKGGAPNKAWKRAFEWKKTILDLDNESSGGIKIENRGEHTGREAITL